MKHGNGGERGLPPPNELGLPAKFTSWRAHQEEAVWAIAGSDKRFVGLVASTGMGKSATYMAYSVLSGAERVGILTSTKSLQTQLEDDFRSLHAIDIRGKSNYLCVVGDPGDTVEDGACQSGYLCEYKQGGCEYYDRRARAATAPLVVSNYSFWLASGAHGKGIGNFDVLILDEAHNAVDELAGFLSVTINRGDLRGYPVALPSESNWWSWLKYIFPEIEREVLHLKLSKTRDRGTIERLKKAKRLLQKLGLLAALGEKHWIAEETRYGLRWDVTEPGPLAERFLFRGTPKVILSSATVRKKTLELLGVPEGEIELLEYPSTFPVERRPVYSVAGAPRMNFRTSEEEMEIWVNIIDSIIEGRRDRRGIIHTVSFARAEFLRGRSKYGDLMIINETGKGSEGLKVALREYLRRKPAILVSPSVSTGIDLPGSACEYQIIGKIPFPDMRSKVLRARMKVNPEYPAYVAAQVMVQSSGRGMRSEDDRCETFVVDSSLGWFLKRHAEFTPRWWRKALRRVEKIPKAPPPLPEEEMRSPVLEVEALADSLSGSPRLS